MTELEYIATLKSQWPQGVEAASRELLSLACLAVRDFPKSARLWLMRGQLIWLSPDDYFFSETDYVTSVLTAIELDPTLAEAYESLAGYYDGMKEDDEKAAEYYSKAAALRGEALD